MSIGQIFAHIVAICWGAVDALHSAPSEAMKLATCQGLEGVLQKKLKHCSAAVTIPVSVVAAPQPTVNHKIVTFFGSGCRFIFKFTIMLLQKVRSSMSITMCCNRFSHLPGALNNNIQRKVLTGVRFVSEN